MEADVGQTTGQTITINNPLGFKVEQKMLGKCLEHCSRFLHDTPVHITIGITERVPTNAPAHKHPGWLEYSLVIRDEVSMLYVAAVQRKPTTEIEFHS